MKTLVVSNNKGGVGKTFTSKTLAEYAVIVKKMRALLIDLDPQCNLSRRFIDMPLDSDGDYEPPKHPDYAGESDWDGTSSIANLWLDPENIVPYPTRFKGLDILLGHSKDLQKVEYVRQGEIKEQVIERLRNLLNTNQVQDSYDLTIIDTRPSKGPLVQAAMRAATNVIIPTEMAHPSVEGLQGMLSLLVEMDNLYGEMPRLDAIVGNRVRENASVFKAIRDKLNADSMTAPFMLSEHFSLLADYEKSMLFGAPSLFELSDSLKATKQAKLVCNELLNRVIN